MARGHEGGAIGAEDPACRIERQQALITQVTGIAAESAIHSGNSGNERMISIERWTTLSTQPP